MAGIDERLHGKGAETVLFQRGFTGAGFVFFS
jgi:hypothetical protein